MNAMGQTVNNMKLKIDGVEDDIEEGGEEEEDDGIEDDNSKFYQSY